MNAERKTTNDEHEQQQHTAGPWHAQTTSAGQGLVYDDKGRDVAVTYDAKDAMLVSAAPELLDALQWLVVAAGEAAALQMAGLCVPAAVWSVLYAASMAAREAIYRATDGAACWTSAGKRCQEMCNNRAISAHKQD